MILDVGHGGLLGDGGRWRRYGGFGVDAALAIAPRIAHDVASDRHQPGRQDRTRRRLGAPRSEHQKNRLGGIVGIRCAKSTTAPIEHQRGKANHQFVVGSLIPRRPRLCQLGIGRFTTEMLIFHLQGLLHHTCVHSRLGGRMFLRPSAHGRSSRPRPRSHRGV